MASQARGEAGGRVSVVLLGHSYVRRLGEYMSESDDRMNLGLRNVTVHCEAVGGATLGPTVGRRRDKCIRRLLPAVAAHQPDVIFVHIGENDLGRMPPGRIATELLDLVTELANLSRSRVVIVGQLICFPATEHLYPRSVQHINSTLRRQMPAGHAFWNHRCCFSRRSGNFLRDNVHLNRHGMRRYWKSVRTAVGRVLLRTQR